MMASHPLSASLRGSASMPALRPRNGNCARRAIEPLRGAPVLARLPEDGKPEAGIPFEALDAAMRRCRRPLWPDDGKVPPVAQQRYCGAPARPGASWCAACAARMTEKLPPKVKPAQRA